MRWTYSANVDRKLAAVVVWGLLALVLTVMTSVAAPPFSEMASRARPSEPPAV